MGILSSLLNTLAAKPRAPRKGVVVKANKPRRVEHLEPRQLMAADLGVSSEILLGATYFEEATGDDTAPDVIQVSFEGGAVGTTLNRLVIDGDKSGDGASVGDVFFDTQSGGLGAFASVGLTVVSHEGFTIDGFTVVDGGSQIVFHTSGWDAGEKLVFSVDADEFQFFENGAVSNGTIVDPTGVDTNALVEGGEFQRSILTGDFTATGYEDMTLSASFWDDFDGRRTTAENATSLQLDLPDDKYSDTNDFTDRTAGAVVHAPQVLLPTIEGTVFHDINLDNDQDPGDLGIAGVELALWKLEGGTYVNTGMTATTDANGHYVFCDGMDGVRLLPGTYQVREAQPEPYFSVGADAGRVGAEPRGSVLNVDTITGITVASGEHSIENDFAESLPAAISGYVFVDYDDDGHYDAGIEPGIAGVTIQVIALDTVNGSTGIRTLTTDENGFYEATGLVPGKYRVVEVQPPGYFDGKDEAGTVLGVTVGAAVNPGDEINGIMLGGGQAGVQYNFGELPPGSISGRIHVDPNGDCDWDNPEQLLAGVTVDLLDDQGNVLETTTTNELGEYRFENLAPGIYQVREHQPSEYFDGGERIGSLGGSTSDADDFSFISNIILAAGQQGINYDFCEFIGATLSGYVYHDRSDDGSFDRPGEEGIGGVVLKLMDANGNDTGLRATTNSIGFYQFTDLAAGTYCVMEVHPAGWLDGTDTPGSHGGSADNPPPGDMICDVILTYGDNATEYNFGELLAASIAGRVHASTDGDCDFDDPDILIEGVQIDLLDSAGNVIETTYTNADGEYIFTGLRPGEYRVHEHQPTGFYDGGERAGTAGGVVTNDLITDIMLGSGENATQYDFCEKIGVTLSGYVYHDRSNDGSFDRPSEAGIGGVTLKLIDAAGNDTGLRAVTDANGFYQFSNLEAGTYCVMEIQPTGWLDGLDTPGNLGGEATNPGDMICEITIDYGEAGVEYNFGELLPGSIMGVVHVTTTPDCEPDENYPPLSGVTIQLLNSAGEVIAITLTDDEGRYKFDNLPPGHYSVRQLQPEDYFDAGYHIGTGGGSFFGANHMGDILVGSDQHLAEYDFCEMPPAQLSGYVFIDGAPIVTTDPLPEDISPLRDGQRTGDDTPLVGIVIELRDGTSGEPIFSEDVLPGIYPDGPLRTTTDANGFYQFTGLPGGTYAVVEIHPEGLIDGIDTQGSLGGLAVNPLPSGLGQQIDHMTELESQIISQFRLTFGNDAIARIPLGVGQSSVENNFSEVRVQPFFFPPEDPPPPLPPPVFFGPPAPLAPPYDPLFRITRVTVEPFGFGGSVGGWTWHLSVVNGGQPRSMRIDEASRVLLNTQMLDTTDIENDIERGEWLRLIGEDENGDDDTIEALVFGNPDARPVSGDWDGDGREEMGIFLHGHWLLDLNGNGRWDASDLYARLGTAADLPATGDWDGDGKTDIAIFGPAWLGDLQHIAFEAGQPDAENYPSRIAGKMKNMPPVVDEATLGNRALRLTENGEPRADLIDHVFDYGVPDDFPITGDWNGDGIATIGVFRGGTFWLDINGDGRFDERDASFAFGEGVPVVGDWNGDGIDDIGTYAAGRWTLDSNGDRALDARDRVFEMGTANDQPIAGDWDGDGYDEPAVYHPTQGREIRVSRAAG